MGRVFNCLPSKNTSLRSPFMTTKSPCRSPSSRLNSASCNSPKTWRLWHNTHNSNFRPPIKRPSISNHRPGLMRNCHDRINLFTTNRPKIINRLLLRKPHRPSCRGNPNPNAVRLYRRPPINNCPRPSFLGPFLPSQHNL